MSDPPAPSVSLFVASLNTAASTELCVRSARRLAGYPFSMHVGDCGSTDGSIAMLRRLEAAGLLSLDVAPEGRFHADWLDHWLVECTDEYAVFADSDVEFRREGWLRELVQTAVSANAAMVAAEMLPEIRRYEAPSAGLRPEDRAVMLERWFRGHETVSLAARPAPWLLLVDVGKVGPLGVGFGFQVDLSPGEERTFPMAYDVGGALYREVQSAGLAVAVMPDSYRAAYHHYGGLSWVPLKGRRGVKKRRDLLEVRARLWAARR